MNPIEHLIIVLAKYAYIRSTVMLVILGFVFLLARRASASQRHGLLTVGVVGLYLFPILSFFAPTLHVPLSRSIISRKVDGSPSFGYVQTSSVAPLQGYHAVKAAASAKLQRLPAAKTPIRSSFVSAEKVLPEASRTGSVKPNFPQLLIWIWLIGCAVMILRLIVSHVAARRLVQQSLLIEASKLSNLADRFRSSCRVVTSDKIRTPIVWGISPPVIALPSDSLQTWTKETVDTVFAHETAHIKRRDWLTQLLSEVALTLYWLNPLVWILARQYRIEAEKACDDMVLLDGIVPSAYAGELIEHVRQAKRNRTWLASVAMADKSSVKTRIQSVLDASQNRSQISRRYAAAVALAGIFLVVFAGITWAQADAKGATITPASTSWIRTLPNGLTIELVGITSDPMGGDAQGWWSPDGKPIANPREDLPAFERQQCGFGEQYQRRVVYYRIYAPSESKGVGLIGKITRPVIAGDSYGWRGETPLNNELHVSASTPVSAEVPLMFNTPTDKFDYAFGVTTDQWHTVADMPNTLHPKFADVSAAYKPGRYAAYVNIDAHPAVADYDHNRRLDSISLLPPGMSDLGDSPRRFMALDSSGQEVILPQVYRSANGDAMMEIPSTLISKIARFRLQTRDAMTWVKFDNISANPDHIPGVISPADDIPIPAPLPRFTRSLPNGATVSVIAAMRDKDEGERWWLPDGTPLKGRIKLWQTGMLLPGWVKGVRARQIFAVYNSPHVTDFAITSQMSTNAGSASISTGEQLVDDGQDKWIMKNVDDLFENRMAIGPTADKMLFRVGVANGVWKHLGSLTLNLNMQDIRRTPDISRTPAGPVGLYNAYLFIGDKNGLNWTDQSGKIHTLYFSGVQAIPTGDADRVEAVLQDGTKRTIEFGSSYSRGRKTGQYATFWSDPSRRHQFGPPDLADIRQFDLEVQPYTWVTFPAISADPKG